MLEPVARPGTGVALNAIGALLAVVGIFVPETVTTSGGVVPFLLLMPPIAVGFAVRAFALAATAQRGESAMSWGARVGSWVCFGLAGALLGLSGSAAAVGAFGAFVALDAAAGLAKRRAAPPAPRETRLALWAKAKRPLLVALYLASVAGLHFALSVHLPYGTLLTWSLLSLGFALLVRSTLVGGKATEAMLRAPAQHRRHERREEPVADPQRERAEAVLLRLRAQGDAASFLDLVRDAARYADLPEREVEALTQRIGAPFSRVGTRREEDIAAALDEVDRSLSPRRVREITP